MGYGHNVFTQGLGVWYRISYFRRNWVEVNLFTTDGILKLLVTVAS